MLCCHQFPPQLAEDGDRERRADQRAVIDAFDRGH